MIQPFEAYQKFLAIRQHFTSPSYDYFKYNGKVRATEQSFQKRRDCYMFGKLGKMYDLERRIAIAFVDGEEWVSGIVSREGELKYLAHVAIIESLTYRLTNEYLPLIDDIKAAIQTGNPPKLLSMYLRKAIPIEILIVFDDMFDVVGLWDSKLKADPLWQKTKVLLVNYRPFFVYDKARIHKLIVDILLNKG